MSASIGVLNLSFSAEADLSSSQYRLMKLGSSAGQVKACDGVTDTPIGVLQNDPTSGQAASVRVLGTTKVVAGAAITRGAFLKTDAQGRAVSTSTDNDPIFGRALEAASAAGEIIEATICTLAVARY